MSDNQANNGNDWKNKNDGKDGGSKPARQKKTVMSTKGWALEGEKLPGGDSAPIMQFDIGANNPRLRLYANKDDKYIQANLGPKSFFAIVGALKMIRENPEPSKFSMAVKHFYDQNGQKHDQPIETCRIWIGRDKSRVIFITVTAPDFEPIKFPFLPTFFGLMEDEEGNVLDKATMSEMTFDGFMALGMATYGASFAQGYSDNNNAPKENASGGWNNNRSNWKGNGGNNNRGNWQGNGGGGKWQGGGNRGNWNNNGGGGNNNRGNWNGGGGNRGNWNGGGNGGNGNRNNWQGNKGNYSNNRSQENNNQAAPPPEKNDDGNNKWEF